MITIGLFLGCRTLDDNTTAASAGTGSCELAPDNAIRATCTVELARPGPVTVEVSDGVHTALFTDTPVSESHTVPLWGMTADADWSYIVRSDGAEIARGTFRTGALPPGLSFLQLQEGKDAPSNVRHILTKLGCDGPMYAVFIDLDGVVWWYQDVQPSPDFDVEVKTVKLGDDDEILVLMGREQVASFDLTGRAVFRHQVGLPVHHDVVRVDGITYFLMADVYVEEDGNRYVEDMVGGIDAEGNMPYLFEFHDNFPVDPPPGGISAFWSSEFPNAIDAYHTNGIHVTPEQDLYFTVKRQDALVKVSGGDFQWAMVGTGDGTYLPTSFELVPANGGDPSFKEPHHPTLHDNGLITLFDNSAPRGLELDVDEETGTATFSREWVLEASCPFESSVYPLDGDHWLLTCASEHSFTEFDADQQQIRSLQVGCESGDLELTTRGQPVDLWELSVGTVTATRR